MRTSEQTINEIEQTILNLMPTERDVELVSALLVAYRMSIERNSNQGEVYP